MDKIKAFVVFNGTQTQVNPLFEKGIEISYEKQQGYPILLPKLNTAIKFIGSDFQFFLNIDNTDRCALITIFIQELCGSDYIDIYSGEFGTVDGSFDLDNCSFTIEPNINSIYVNLISGQEHNIVDITGNHTVKNGNTQYLNCKKFEDVLLFLAQKSDSRITSIVSDFFQINPLNISTLNYVTGLPNLMYSGMFFSPLSNIRNPIPTDLASVERVSFKDIIDDLKSLFNVDWIISGTSIRIEHISFFNTQQGLDLTQSIYAKFMIGKSKYSYDRDKSPKYEKFTQFSSDQAVLIEYDNACGKNKINDNQIEYSTKKIYTDLYRALFEGDKLSRNTKGLMLLSVGRLGGIQGNVLIGFNVDLSIPALVLRFHRHNRPNKSGKLKILKHAPEFIDEDYGSFLTKSVTPVKKQIEIIIKNCCSNLLDVTKLIKTNFGWGALQLAKYTPIKNILKLNIQHKLSDDFVDLDTTAISVMPNLDLWLRFNRYGLDSNNKVSVWFDDSPNNRHANQADSNARPEIVSGIVKFSQSNFLKTPQFQLFPNAQGTLFVAIKNNYLGESSGDNTVISTNKGLLTAGAYFDFSFKFELDNTVIPPPGQPNGYIYRPWNFFENKKYPTETKHGNYLNAISWNGNMIFTMRRNGSDKLEFFINGKQTKDHFMQLAIPQQPVLSELILGYDGDSRFAGSVYLLEVMVFGRNLSDEEIQAININIAQRTQTNLYTAS